MSDNFDVDIDPNILLEEGATEYVAMNYTWEAAIHFWDKTNSNAIADTLDNYSMHAVTEKVNYYMDDDEYDFRDEKYQNWLNTYEFPT